MEERRGRLPALNALRAFEASARHLNFRLAAGELGVTQGAVAQHVRGLEADLGIRLFNRLPRSLALTDQGRGYASHLRRAFELMREATAALRPETLHVTISATPSFASKWLISHLPKFTEAHPDIELHVLATENLSNFQSDGVDIAVRQARPPFGPGLVANLLFEQEVVAVCNPSLLGRPPHKLAPEDLDRFTLLNDAHDLWPEFIERALKRPVPAILKRVRFSQTSLAIDAAIAGQGLAVASRFLVEQDLQAGRLLQAFDAVMRGALDFFVVTPRKPRHPTPTAMVREWLLSEPRT
ncbi:LysR family transcriptional regulator, glycine cleavage system transcriptional activator [Rhizobiales bacterium GAS191]|nr:LysR family transcriptional regulator, glycine cleavage system transcriptional activator [Rhizobiales bacterium GAS113]SED70099.1 LysR family transcriptional regulator, glycine cleavage system transcriptional activator [Rhizobiales bacterium GAS188]SEE82339.1 LysR family transcriptional regulator, glycine cleavage system transcriptional activator [Rhizobiales bacterium GAS191]